MKVLLMATDAYGGHGGIAYYNRCLAEALIEIHGVERVELLSRVIDDEPIGVPPRIKIDTRAARGKLQYIVAVFRRLFYACDLVICGHINLLPLAAAFAMVKRIPLVLQVHGIDVWREPRNRWVPLIVRRVTAIWSVSNVTRDRMNVWAKMPLARYRVIPNTIHSERYGIEPKRADLQQRFGIVNKKVVLTLARLDSRERYKGIDEILDALPELRRIEPSVCYLIAGLGDDRPRLATKARDLGVSDCVVFGGYIPEEDKADVIRLADVFAMPGRGEGFGIVYLEAMACGVPVIGSTLDGSQEALRGGELGELVDPSDPANLTSAIMRAFLSPRRVPTGLEYFEWEAFVRRVGEAVHGLAPKSPISVP